MRRKWLRLRQSKVPSQARIRRLRDQRRGNGWGSATASASCLGPPPQSGPGRGIRGGVLSGIGGGPRGGAYRGRGPLRNRKVYGVRGVAVFPRLGLLVIDVDFQAEAKLAAVGVRAADGPPRLVAALATACGVACAPERVQPLQQRVSVSALGARLSGSCNTGTQEASGLNQGCV